MMLAQTTGVTVWQSANREESGSEIHVVLDERLRIDSIWPLVEPH